MIPQITHNQVVECLHALDIHKGDGLMIHSAVQFLGKPEGGISMYLDAIRTVIGPEGTVAVPTFNFDFAREGRFDPQQTPSQGMGAFSEFIRQQPGTMRTSHPMQSFAVIGRYASDLAQRDTPSAFDAGSACERVLQLGFKLLLLGANIKYVAMVHYSEQRFRVPYRFWKEFRGQVYTPTGWVTRTYRMYVRDLDVDAHLTLEPVQKLLLDRNHWQSAPVNYGQISSCNLVDFVQAADDLLSKDPWALVENRPL